MYKWPVHPAMFDRRLSPRRILHPSVALVRHHLSHHRRPAPHAQHISTPSAPLQTTAALLAYTSTPNHSALPPVACTSPSHCTTNRSTVPSSSLPLRLSARTRAKLST